MPPSLAHLRHELGLIDPVWTTYGEDWRSLATLWLRTEMTLSKTGRQGLSFNDIRRLTILDVIKDWMYCKQLSQDGKPPSGDGFRKIWMEFLRALPIAKWKKDKTILEEMWCRPGKTGIIVFVLGLYWQAEYSGAGHDWKQNLKCVGEIFDLILAHPDL